MKNSFLRPALFASAVLMYGCGNTPKQTTHIDDQSVVGQECSVGASKTADDGCNTCTCDEKGWACTEMACPDPVSTTCTDGETKQEDCNSCSCMSGAWACTKMACIDKPSAQSGGECPAPQASAEMCAQVIVWSKSEDGKSCCQYATPCHAPKGWKQFPSEAACSR